MEYNNRPVHKDYSNRPVHMEYNSRPIHLTLTVVKIIWTLTFAQYIWALTVTQSLRFMNHLHCCHVCLSLLTVFPNSGRSKWSLYGDFCITLSHFVTHQLQKYFSLVHLWFYKQFPPWIFLTIFMIFYEWDNSFIFKCHPLIFYTDIFNFAILHQNTFISPFSTNDVIRPISLILLP